MSGSQAQRWLLFVCFLILKIIFGQTVEKIGSKNQGPLNTDSKKTTSMWLSQRPKQERVWCSEAVNITVKSVSDWRPFLMSRLKTSYIRMCVLSHFSHVQLGDPMDSSPPGSSVHGILQARVLEWVVLSHSKGSSQPQDWTCISYVSCTGRQVLYH